MFKVLELSGPFVCLVGRVTIFSAWGGQRNCLVVVCLGGSVPRPTLCIVFPVLMKPIVKIEKNVRINYVSFEWWYSLWQGKKDMIKLYILFRWESSKVKNLPIQLDDLTVNMVFKVMTTNESNTELQNHAKSAPSSSPSSLEKMIDTNPKKVGRPSSNNSAMTPNTLKNHQNNSISLKLASKKASENSVETKRCCT